MRGDFEGGFDGRFMGREWRESVAHLLHAPRPDWPGMPDLVPGEQGRGGLRCSRRLDDPNAHSSHGEGTVGRSVVQGVIPERNEGQDDCGGS